MKVVLGTKLKAQGYGSKRRLVEKEEIMVYVPILKTLEVLLNDSAILAEVRFLHIYSCTVLMLMSINFPTFMCRWRVDM